MRFKLSSRRSTNNGGDCCVWGSCDSHSRSLYLFTKIFSKAGKKNRFRQCFSCGTNSDVNCLVWGNCASHDGSLYVFTKYSHLTKLGSLNHNACHVCFVMQFRDDIFRNHVEFCLLFVSKLFRKMIVLGGTCPSTYPKQMRTIFLLEHGVERLN
jgi:hypothetical protein